MKTLIRVLAIAVAAIAYPALAASDKAASRPTGNGSACEAQAADKKLPGAARNSFVKKCGKDATSTTTAACESRDKEKKLSGAAEKSFV